MADIVLVNPRFEVSYWGLEHALPLTGKRANLPTACLPLLAALTPAEHRVTIVDENVEPIDYARLARADLVGLTGMNVQRQRMREILVELRERDIFTVVGGPWVSVREDDLRELADVLFIGEAEETWPQFLREWEAGNHGARYEQAQRTDMTQVPIPRLDLLRMDQYLFGSVQFSRGCPFQCEFCDIIVTFGRRPRLKTAGQVLAEVEALWRCGMEIVFIVDDNLIGNKKAIRPLLEALAGWQETHGYPLTFFTEASLNLAEDPGLMEAMVAANVQAVFVGVESPNESSLRETKKLQNVGGSGTIAQRVRRIQEAGLDVWCGMILGFDHDDATVFDAHRRFIDESRIMHAMVGMLTAIPKTPLYRRLEEEGRLDEEEAPLYGTNVVPQQMTREELREGYIHLMEAVYEPANYFDRFEALYIDGRFRFGAAQRRHWRRHPWTGLKALARNVARSAVLYRQLMRGVPEPALRSEYRRRVARLLRRDPDPATLFVLLVKCAAHYHYFTMARNMARDRTKVVNPF